MVSDIHRFTLHVRLQWMQVVLQYRYWVNGARNLMRSIYDKCMKRTCLNRYLVRQSISDLAGRIRDALQLWRKLFIGTSSKWLERTSFQSTKSSTILLNTWSKETSCRAYLLTNWGCLKGRVSKPLCPSPKHYMKLNVFSQNKVHILVREDPVDAILISGKVCFTLGSKSHAGRFPVIWGSTNPSARVENFAIQS